MKYIVSFIILFTFLGFNRPGGIYDIPIETMTGKIIGLDSFKGKKMVFIVVPPSVSDTSVSYQHLREFQARYRKSIVIIGVPMEGVAPKLVDTELEEEYKRLGGSFVLTKEMMVKEGPQQSILFKWLTHKDKNGHFDCNTINVGSKFFVSETGELYAVLGSEVKLSNPIIDRIVAKPPGAGRKR